MNPIPGQDILVAVGTTPFGPPTTRRHSQPGYKAVHHAGGSPTFSSVHIITLESNLTGLAPLKVTALEALG